MNSSLTSRACPPAAQLRFRSERFTLNAGWLPASQSLGALDPAANGRPPLGARTRLLALGFRIPQEVGADWRRRRPMGGTREARGQ